MVETGALIKFGCRKHMEELLHEGILYMNTLDYFRNVEDEELRGDPDDSVEERVEIGVGSFVEVGKNRIPIKSGILRKEYFSNFQKVNVFCMYALRPFSKASYPIDERNFDFGDSAVVFFNSQEFMDRVSKKAKEQKISIRGDLVDYVGDQQYKDRGPFIKRDIYSYQHEWRIFREDGDGKPIRFCLGDLSDIAGIFTSIELNNKIKIYNQSE